MADFAKIWAEVKKAVETERACPAHNFVSIAPSKGDLPLKVRNRAKVRCTCCGYELTAVQHYWYERGRRDAEAKERK